MESRIVVAEEYEGKVRFPMEVTPGVFAITLMSGDSGQELSLA